MQITISSPAEFLKGKSVPIPDPSDGRIHCPVEDLWDLVRAWAAEQGYEYVSTYGVVGVAPT